MGERSSKSFLSEAAEDLLRGPVMLGQAIKYTASGLREKSKARDKETALNKARQQLDDQRPQSKGSRGRDSAGKQRDNAAKELVESGAVRSNSGTVDGRIQDMVKRDMAMKKKK